MMRVLGEFHNLKETDVADSPPGLHFYHIRASQLKSFYLAKA
jgi:hypothetical protein